MLAVRDFPFLAGNLARDRDGLAQVLICAYLFPEPCTAYHAPTLKPAHTFNLYPCSLHIPHEALPRRQEHKPEQAPI